MKTKLMLLTAALGLAAASGRAQYSLTALNTAVTDNFNSFTGDGLAPSPTAGQLDSDAWRVTGFSDGDSTFGGTSDSGDFARGTDDPHNGVTSGGLYGFIVGANDNAIGIQPGGSDWTPGTLTAIFTNNTGNTVSQIDLSYDILVWNDQGRANSFNFAWSTDDSSYTAVNGLDFTSPAAADGSPSWVTTNRSTSITGLSLANGSSIYLQWRGDDASGSGSRDEFALDNLSVTAVPEPSSIALIALAGLTAVGIARRRR